MPKIVPIVEGDGEVDAVPTLLRRVLHTMHRWDIQIARPKNAHGVGSLAREEGLERFLRYAAMEPECVGIIVIRDNDDSCAKYLAHNWAARADSLGLSVPVVIVCPTREYEAWFLASLETICGKSLGGRPGLPEAVRYDGDVEDIRGAKAWLSRHMPDGRAYKETEDQAPMTEYLDLDLVCARSRSFRRLVHAVQELLEAIDADECKVTPTPPSGGLVT